MLLGCQRDDAGAPWQELFAFTYSPRPDVDVDQVANTPYGLAEMDDGGYAVWTWSPRPGYDVENHLDLLRTDSAGHELWVKMLTPENTYTHTTFARAGTRFLYAWSSDSEGFRLYFADLKDECRLWSNTFDGWDCVIACATGLADGGFAIAGKKVYEPGQEAAATC